MKHNNFRGCRWRNLTWFAAGVMLAGCQSWQTTSPDITMYWQYQDQLILATEAINAGDLTVAKEHLAKADVAAASPGQNRKVRSLERLVAGTEALMAGEPDRARAEWAGIEEPHLKREVRHKARLIGMDVPMDSNEIEAN